MTARCTFDDLFKDYLRMAVGQGGTVETVIRWVRAYEDGHPLVRREVFAEWLEHELFLCEKCGREFKANGDESLEDQVLCIHCMAWERGYDEARGRRR